MFKINNTIEKRKDQFNKIKQKHPDKIPIIVEICYEKKRIIKFIVSEDITILNLMSSIRKRENLSETEAHYIFTEKKTLLPVSSSLDSVYHNHKDEDGFLYMYLHKENVFG